MSIRAIAKRSLLVCVVLVTGPACDLVAEGGQTLVLGGRGSVLGSGGNAQRAPLPAVRVRSGSGVVVEDADLSGGGIVVERVDQQRYGAAGPGISSDGGTVTVQQGMVRGGSIVLMAPVSSFDAPAPGIEAKSSRIEISGGSVVGGSIVSFVMGQFPSAQAAPALRASDSLIRVTGGSFAPGMTLPTNPVANPPVLNLPFVATRSNVEIRGGDFGDGIAMVDGTARIFGGRGFALSFQNTSPQGCSEVRGGQFQTLTVTGGRVLVFGTGLTLIPDIGSTLLRGTLEDGTPSGLHVLGGLVLPLRPLEAGCPSPGTTRFVGVNMNGQPGNAFSVASAITPDGRFVVFTSRASDLVPNDTNGSDDVFVRDLTLGTTQRVSVTSSGAQGFGNSFDASISADGRFVAFSSEASLAAPAVQGSGVFLRDRQTGRTELVSVSNTGEVAVRLPSNGRVSDDGRFVAFVTEAGNLVPEDTNGVSDVFVRDRVAGATRRVSVGSNGEQGDDAAVNMSMSADGRFIAFRSFARNLIGDPSVQGPILVRDTVLGRIEVATVTPTGQAFGGGPDAVISGNGRFVAFSQSAQLFGQTSDSNLDVFVRDRMLGVTERISQGGAQFFFAGAISADGRFVAFNSADGGSAFSTALVRDRIERRTEVVNLTNDGRSTGFTNFPTAVSADGRRVVFVSDASDLVDGDTNNDADAFVRERGN